MKRIVIIGGGISGLAAAHQLLTQSSDAKQQIELILIEAGSHPGGIVQTDAHDGFLLERGPDSFISEKPAALELAKRLVLESQLIQTNSQNRRSFVVSRGKLLPVPEGFQLIAPSRFSTFLQSDIFSWSGKARIALELLLPRRSGKVEDDESLAQFVRRRLGREALARIAQPMVGGIYTADPELLSLRATMPRFLEMEREHRSLILAMRRKRSVGGDASDASGARYSLFLSFDRGMQVLTDALARAIADFRSPLAENSSGPLAPPAQIKLNTSVDSLTLNRESDQPRWTIKTESGETILADALLLAVPAFVSARLLRKVDAQLAAELSDIKYASTATINFAYQRNDIPHALDGFGFVVPFIEKQSLIACTFSSQKFAGRAPAGHVLLRVFVGGALQPQMLELDDTEILTRVRNDLRQLLGIVKAPLFAEVSRWQNSMPQYHVGHLDRVKRIDEIALSLPGLALAGNAYTGPGIPDCVRSGQEAAKKVWSLQS
ncbi:MAG TPA: protoporphyrinogen oxidase [Pyrinomonadaceae bacterium]|nr:protoporphyrinogen oxidase [Pyrinomonadaceae bacterium]